MTTRLKNGLTPRQEEIAQTVLRHSGNLTKAAAELFPNAKPDSRRQIVSKYVNRHIPVRLRVLAGLESQGATPEKAAKIVASAMKSKKMSERLKGAHFYFRLTDCYPKQVIVNALQSPNSMHLEAIDTGYESVAEPELLALTAGEPENPPEGSSSEPND